MEVLTLVDRLGLIFGLVAIGFLLVKVKVVSGKDTKVLADIVILVATPALMFTSMIGSCDIGPIANYSVLFVAGVFMPLLLIVIAYFAARIMKLGRPKLGVFLCANAFPNTVFIGLPVTVALYGNETVASVAVLDFAVTLVFWTIGLALLTDNFKWRGLGSLLNAVLNAPFVVLIISLLLALAEVKPPSLLLDMGEMIGQIAIPLSLLLIGMTMATFTRASMEFDKSIGATLFLRHIVSPLIMLLVVYSLPIPILSKQVLVLQAGLPTMMGVSIVAQAYGKEHGYATSLVVASTIASLVTIPLVAYTLGILL